MTLGQLFARLSYLDQKEQLTEIEKIERHMLGNRITGRIYELFGLRDDFISLNQALWNLIPGLKGNTYERESAIRDIDALEISVSLGDTAIRILQQYG